MIVVVAAGIPSARSTVGVGIILGLFWLDAARPDRAGGVPVPTGTGVRRGGARAGGQRAADPVPAHLVPNALGSIVVFLTLAAATSVLAEASLTFLGYGVQGDDTSLGRLVSDGVSAADSRPWLFYLPSLVLMILVMSVNAVGEGIRGAFDPANQRIRS